jgi:Domain of unknown function (DUF4604)
VDGESNILSKAEYEAMLNVEGQEVNVDSHVVDSTAYPDNEEIKVAEHHTEDIRSSKGLGSIAGIGERKKRKAGKAVGVEFQDDGPAEDDKPQVGKAKSKNKPKKAKKVKLSFAGDEDGGGVEGK